MSDQGPDEPRNFWRQRIWAATIIVVTIVAGTTLSSLFARSHWIADLCANLRVQQVIAILIAVSITVCLRPPYCLRNLRLLVIELILLAIHIPWFAAAWSSDAPDTVGSDNADTQLVAMVANVLTTNDQHDLVVQQIHDIQPDVVAILELGTPLARRLETDVAGDYPFRMTVPQDRGNFGIGVYSRHQLSDVKQFALNIDSIQSIAATIHKDGRMYRMIATHPLPPMGAQGFANRNRHLKMLAKRIDQYRHQHPEMPMIVMGDFNLTPWSPLLSDFESQTKLRRAGRGFGITPTWYAKQNFAFGLLLDHGFISDDLKCDDQIVGPDIGSDHRSVTVRLRRQVE